MSKKGLALLLIISLVVLLVVNSTFILANSTSLSSSNYKSERSILNLVKLNYEDNSKNDENEREVPITGTHLERASAVSLEYIGEGRVTDSEIGDEEGYYEIEITTNDGEVDVHLDENFNILSTEWEDEEDDD